MIYESYIWKKELYKNFLLICKFRQLLRPSEQSYVNLEKAIMTCAYIMRKLNDAQKIPPEFLKQNISVQKYNIKIDFVDHMNWHRLNKNYNLENGQNYSNNYQYFINQIIHSFTFINSYDDQDKFDGFFLNTDMNKNKEIYHLPIKKYLTLILKISEGTIIESDMQQEMKMNLDGTVTPGEMKQIAARYGYPDNFDLRKAINQSLKGNYYIRENA